MWLMIRSAIEKVERARATGVAAAGMPREGRAPELRLKRGNVAVIPIRGPLLNEPDAALDFFGMQYTLYSEIRDLVSQAEGRKAKRIDFDFDSPGGTIDGLYETMRVIKSTPTRTRSIAGPTMASAAYMLASQTDRIDAVDDLSMVGSVGVATERLSVDWIKSIANTDSPKKRPDLDTDEGVAAVQEELDDIYQVLAERIAAGRNVPIDTVKKDYGQGAMMTARTALGKKMIDGIIADQSQTATNNDAVAEMEKVMTLDDLREQHPSIYREALRAGATKERSRVTAHLIMADASGDLATAVEAIKAGTEPDAAAQAHHTAFGIRKRAVELRAEEAPPPVATSNEPPEQNEVLMMKAQLEKNCKGLAWEVQ